MMAAARYLSWLDLPPELLGLVLKCLPSLADRVRLRAVCHPWRSNALLQPLAPPLPWLTLLDGTFLSIPDGEIIQMPIPDDACCYGSIDNWLFLVYGNGKCSLMNPFTKDTLELPDLSTGWHHGRKACSEFNPSFCKLVVPSPLESSPASLIAIVHDFFKLCIFQPPVVADTIKGSEPLEPLCEVSFFGGKLYAVGCLGNLLIIKIDQSLGSKPKISSIECIIDSIDDLSFRPEPLSRDEGCLVKPYLVECAGRLLMVKRWICPLHPEPCFFYDRTGAFEVFEADLSTKPGQWRKVNDLGGQALFVGTSGSKSFPAGECSGVKENCIYFMNDFPGLKTVVDPLHDSGVYNIRNKVITPLLSETVAVPPNIGGYWCPMWLFPAQTM